MKSGRARSPAPPRGSREPLALGRGPLPPVDEVLDRALDALDRTVGPDRAAVLLADWAGAMRLRAWRRLSASQRRALDGHWPWPRDVRDPSPILVEDAAAEPGRAPGNAWGVRAFASIPLAPAGRLLGVLTLCFDQPHPFTPEEVLAARAVAAHVGSALDRRELERALRFKDTLLELQAEANQEGILVVSLAGRVISYNRRFAEIWGIPGEVLEARDDGAALAWIADRLAEPDGFSARIRYLRDHPMEEDREEIELRDGRVLERYAAPVVADDGSVLGRACFFRDVTGRRREEERQRFLAAAGEVFGAGLDHERTPQRIAQLAVHGVADWCVVYLRDRDGSLRTKVAHRDPALKPVVRRYVRRFADTLSPRVGPRHAHRGAAPRPDLGGARRRRTGAFPPVPGRRLEGRGPAPRQGIGPRGDRVRLRGAGPPLRGGGPPLLHGGGAAGDGRHRQRAPLPRSAAGPPPGGAGRAPQRAAVRGLGRVVRRQDPRGGGVGGPPARSGRRPRGRRGRLRGGPRAVRVPAGRLRRVPGGAPRSPPPGPPRPRRAARGDGRPARERRGALAGGARAAVAAARGGRRRERRPCERQRPLDHRRPLRAGRGPARRVPPARADRRRRPQLRRVARASARAGPGPRGPVRAGAAYREPPPGEPPPPRACPRSPGSRSRPRTSRSARGSRSAGTSSTCSRYGTGDGWR